MDTVRELQYDYGLSCSEIEHLKRKYKCTDDDLLEVAKRTMTLGIKLHSVEELLKQRQDAPKYHRLSFCRQDGISVKTYNKHGGQAKFKDFAFKKETGLDASEFFTTKLLFYKYKNLRCTGSTVLEVLNLYERDELKDLFACVRYDDVPYYFNQKEVIDAFVFSRFLMALSSHVCDDINTIAGKLSSDFEDILQNTSISDLFQKYFYNCLSQEFNVSTDNILNFGSWLLSYLRYNKNICTDKSCILLDKATNRAHLIINEYSFYSLLKGVSTESDLPDMVHLCSEPRSAKENMFSYWLEKLGLDNYIVLLD